MKSSFRIYVSVLALAALAGCATQGKPPPTISLDEPVQAQPLPEPPEVEEGLEPEPEEDEAEDEPPESDEPLDPPSEEVEEVEDAASFPAGTDDDEPERESVR